MERRNHADSLLAGFQEPENAQYLRRVKVHDGARGKLIVASGLRIALTLRPLHKSGTMLSRNFAYNGEQ